jgi:hypothetical protein
LSDREVQLFDKGRVQFPGALGISKHLLQSPVSTDYRSSLDLHKTIVPTGFDDLAVQTRRSKDMADDRRIKGESARGDQRDTFEIRSPGEIPEESECVSIASSSHDCRRPKPRPDFNHGEDPGWLFLTPYDCSHLVCLKLCHGEPFYFSIAEATTPVRCSFQPAMDRIPGHSHDSSHGGLVQPLDAESRHLIQDGATVLESLVRRTGIRAERLPTSPATVSTPFPPLGLVEAVENDGSGVGFSRPRALPVWTAETLHGFWILSTVELVA